MELQKQMNNLANIAVEYAQSFDEVLDFSKESITAVERILDYYSNDLHNCSPEEKPTENQTWSMATIWGAYIGEVMRRELGPDFVWIKEEAYGSNVPQIRNNRTETGSFPIDKVYKRLVNGSEDNIVTYVDVGMDYLKGNLDLPSGHVLYIKVDGDGD